MPTISVPSDISTITLRRGCGSGKEGDRCAIQEYRAWRGLDASNDACPDDVCPVLHRLVIGLNDVSPAWRKALVPWLVRLTGTRTNAATRQRRAFKAADWAVRVFAPIALDAADLSDQAAGLRALAPIVDETTDRAAEVAAWAAAEAAAAARDAADPRAAAWAARAANAAANAANAAAWAANAAAWAAEANAAYAAANAANAAANAAYAAAWAAEANAAYANDPIAFLDSILAITE